MVWLRELILRRIPLLLVVLIRRHHGPHGLVIMLIPWVRTHMRATIRHVVPPLVRWHGHLARPIGHVWIHGVEMTCE